MLIVWTQKITLVYTTETLTRTKSSTPPQASQMEDNTRMGQQRKGWWGPGRVLVLQTGVEGEGVQCIFMVMDFLFFFRGGEGMREDKGKLKKKTWRTRISNKIMYLFMYQDRQCKWCTTYWWLLLMRLRQDYIVIQSHIRHRYRLEQLVTNSYKEKQSPFPLILKTWQIHDHPCHHSASQNLLKHHHNNEADRIFTVVAKLKHFMTPSIFLRYKFFTCAAYHSDSCGWPSVVALSIIL